MRKYNHVSPYDVALYGSAILCFGTRCTRVPATRRFVRYKGDVSRGRLCPRLSLLSQVCLEVAVWIGVAVNGDKRTLRKSSKQPK